MQNMNIFLEPTTSLNASSKKQKKTLHSAPSKLALTFSYHACTGNTLEEFQEFISEVHSGYRLSVLAVGLQVKISYNFNGPGSRSHGGKDTYETRV